jgi:hypothetical protein
MLLQLFSFHVLCHSIYFDGSSLGITGKIKFPKDESCATKYPKEEVWA